MIAVIPIGIGKPASPFIHGLSKVYTIDNTKHSLALPGKTLRYRQLRILAPVADYI